MRRLGIVAGVLGAVAGAIGGYLLAIDTQASAAKGLLGEPSSWITLLLRRFQLSASWFPGGLFACWFGFGPDFQNKRLRAGKAKLPAGKAHGADPQVRGEVNHAAPAGVFSSVRVVIPPWTSALASRHADRRARPN